ncbi:hypothetical protein FGU71_07570 [Erythrobacter insulae]|uniref:Threonine dehydratase n=1 Tax=Erythrobacter insulae TaxID=2584124 RepID=A0A547PF59_9SPHN|nr:hypothetical protein FGU71_07570 [Erythrobacter insulae]
MHGSHDDHDHGKQCGHAALEHAGHVDYLHGSHLHHSHDGHVDEHTLPVSSSNPNAEELVKSVGGEDHMHGHEGEEHDVVQHGAHFDYVHDGRLHHLHGDHTDDHGSVNVMQNT